MKAADVAQSARDWSLYSRWAQLSMEEFYVQVGILCVFETELNSVAVFLFILYNFNSEYMMYHVQGDLERVYAMPISKFMDRTRPQEAHCHKQFVQVCHC